MEQAEVFPRQTPPFVSPYRVARINPYPWERLFSPYSTGLIPLFKDLSETRQALEEHASSLTNRLTSFIPSVEDTHQRRAFITLRRDLYNRRKLRSAEVVPHGHLLKNEIQRYQKLKQRLHDLETRIDSQVEEGLTEELKILRRWASDANVQRSISLSSDALLHSVTRLARETTERPAGRTRKAMPSLVTYHSRSTAKVSPFSRHTVIGLAPQSQESSSGIRSEITTSRALYRLLLRKLASSAETRAQITWKVSDLFRSSGQLLSWTRRRWVGHGGPVDEFTEEIVNLPDTLTWKILVKRIRAFPINPFTYQDLVDYLASGNEDPRSNGFVDRLIDLGVFVPVPPVSEQASDFEEKWQIFLDGLSGDFAVACSEAHLETARVRHNLAEASGPERAEWINKIRLRWIDLLEVERLGESHRTLTDLYYEDAYSEDFADVEPKVEKRWISDLTVLLPALHGLDDQRSIDTAVVEAFHERYGVGGRCDDILLFAQSLRDDLPKKLEFFRSGDNSLASLRRSTIKLFSQWNGSEVSSITLDPADLDMLGRKLDSFGQDRTRSFAIFGQRHGNDFVLNHVYGGEGRFISRFLSSAPDEYKNLATDYVKSFGSSDAITAQLRPTLGFNANLSPLLFDFEVSSPDDITPSRSISAVDLILREENGSLIVETREGVQVEVKYSGFLVPYALPSLELLLACSNGVPYLSFEEISANLVARRVKNEVIHAPRISVGSVVVLRQRWAVLTSTIISFLDDSNTAFRLLNEWRIGEMIPEMVFLREAPKSVDPAKGRSGPKPILVDFMSNMHVSTLRKRLENFGDEILIEECLPNPSTVEHQSPRGSHASEWYFEINECRGTDDKYNSTESSR